MNPLGLFLEPPEPILTHLHNVYMAYSECPPTRLNPLAERTCFSQVGALAQPGVGIAAALGAVLAAAAVVRYLGLFWYTVGASCRKVQQWRGRAAHGRGGRPAVKGAGRLVALGLQGNSEMHRVLRAAGQIGQGESVARASLRWPPPREARPVALGGEGGATPVAAFQIITAVSLQLAQPMGSAS